MTSWVDPRENPCPIGPITPRRAYASEKAIAKLLEWHREKRFYDIEEWIRQGRLLQRPPGRKVKRGWNRTLLEAAVEGGDYALIHLLLANGYQADLETPSPFDQALKDERFDIVELLFTWRVDPARADPWQVLTCRDADLMWRFHQAGCNVFTEHALARALIYRMKDDGLNSFYQRLSDAGVPLQDELNAALGIAAERGRDKLVRRLLDMGADPRAGSGVRSRGRHAREREPNALERAVAQGKVEVIATLKPDPAVDDLDYLAMRAPNVETFKALVTFKPDLDGTRLLSRQLHAMAHPSARHDAWNARWNLERLLEQDVRNRHMDSMFAKTVREAFLAVDPQHAKCLFMLLYNHEALSPAVWADWLDDKAVAKRIEELGLWSKVEKVVPTVEELPDCMHHYPKRVMNRKPEYYIERDRFGDKVLDREELYALVWSEPMIRLAQRFKLSDNGLRKRCKRMKVPYPPRGYWAKVEAGQRPRKARLPKLKKEEIDPYHRPPAPPPSRQPRPAKPPPSPQEKPQAPTVPAETYVPRRSGDRFDQYNHWQRAHIFRQIRGGR